MTTLTNVSTPRTLLVLLAEREIYPAEAARLLRVTPTTLYAWRDGRFRPSSYHFTRLYMMLGCTPEELNAALEATKQQRDGGKHDE